MVSLEQRVEMPALPEEVAAALEENIKINNGWGPNRILGNGKVSAIELKRCTRVFDENGRFSPTYDENETTTLKADQIIVAIGQAIEKESLSNMGVQRSVISTKSISHPGNIRKRRICRR